MSSIHDPRYKKLIQELISIRESKKVTQVELATSLNKPQSYVAKVENLDRRIDVLELQDWLNALDTSIINFLENNL
ncbi:helix-turn-helix domain-containing protein [Acinetobacter lwoffii]|jgi:transcriptional regulator with XRE-family HTH domain|uniref:helix-turn-helix domain-containing protein n=1 Tax=Acinetobacter lwoffii TaxID=28090 RepID=UPI0001BBA8BB|nr:helix-turn-helix transcriptional regulator [Acinetobacter lwoffii]EEY90094.1 DNA-binding helix-turn-helix protein [Acinetobacter lwoffii SH145]ODN54265.1 transcriptional regulator [Acinetobacter sp. 51m]